MRTGHLGKVSIRSKRQGIYPKDIEKLYIYYILNALRIYLY